MVKVKEDMTGWKMWEHGIPDSRLIVIKQVEDYVQPNGVHSAQWLCECNCDKKTKFVVRSNDLRGGHTKSCGCLQIERATNAVKKYNKYKLNLIDEHGLYGIGYCSNTGRKFYFDMDDYNKIKDYCWHERKYTNNYSVPMTRLSKNDAKTMTLPNNEIVNVRDIRFHYLIYGKYSDHLDRNPFNNRKYNLRIATFKENSRNISVGSKNTSGFIGVSIDKRYNKWRAYITVNGRQISLGMFEHKDDAIRARLEGEVKYFGEFSSQRHLFEKYNIKV